MSAIFFIVFIIIALGFVFFSHYFIYNSLVDFFEIISGKLFIIWTLGVLSISFIVTTILVHWQDNPYTRKLYWLAGVWLGIAVNLIIFFLFAWLLIFLSRWLGTNLNLKVLGSLAIVGAIALSIYGVWNSLNPRIKYITVSIKNLPASWENKSVVQISDVHLGPIFTEKFLAQIVEKINNTKPEAVFITGDLFDGTDNRLNGLAKPLDQIVAAQGTYFVTGNHETYIGVDKVKSALKDLKLTYLDDSLVDINGLQVAGISSPLRNAPKDLSLALKNLPNRDASKPLVLLWHEPTQNESAKNAGVDLQLSGHTHNGQIFPFNLITRLIYKKYTVGLNTEGDYNIYTSPGTGGWGPTMRTVQAAEITVIKLLKK